MDLESKLEIEVQKLKKATAEARAAAERDKFNRWKLLFSSEMVLGFVTCVAMILIAGVSCYGCYRTTETDKILAPLGYQYIGGRVSPIEKQ